VLGIERAFMYNLPDNRFDTIPFLDIVKIIEKLIEKIKPSVVYTHHIVHRAVLTATRPIENQPVREIYAFGVSSSTEWAFGNTFSTFHPNVFVNISETLESKIEAFSCYESELRTFPHPRSQRAITAHAQYWGSVVGCNAAEPFELIRSVKLEC
jgi:LmbE family N-acetylglucosaminyl deacetylase